MADKESSEKQEAQELSNSSEKQDETDSVEPEILKNIPPEFKQIVEVGMARLGPVPNPLLQKITSEHIDKILDLSGKDNERIFQDTRSSRQYTLLYVSIGAALFLFLTVYLVPMDKQLYLEIVKSIVLAGGGFGVGFGVKTYLDRNSS